MEQILWTEKLKDVEVFRLIREHGIKEIKRKKIKMDRSRLWTRRIFDANNWKYNKEGKTKRAENRDKCYIKRDYKAGCINKIIRKHEENDAFLRILKLQINCPLNLTKMNY